MRIAVLAGGGALLPLLQASIEQTTHGDEAGGGAGRSFDGIGVGFEGPQGRYEGRNPSDNSLAVGPDHIVQTVNSRIAIFTKKGKKYDTTGKPLYGPVNTNIVFARLRRPVRSAQQRRRRRPLRPARRPLAGHDADLLAHSADRGGRASAAANSRRSTASSQRPGRPRRRARPPRCRRIRRCRRRRRRARPRTARPAGPAAAAARRRRAPTPCATRSAPAPIRSAPYYRYEFVRPLFPDYPASGGLDRRLLHADQHQRQPHLRHDRDAEARLRRRSREDAQRASRPPSSA